MSSSEGFSAGPANPRTASAPDGTAVVFDLYPASGPAAVIIVPGFWRTRHYPSLVAIAARIAARIAPCAVMDIRGHGDSGGSFEFNRDEHQDVSAVIGSLTKESGFERFVLFGFSAGGAIAISTAARHPELPVAGLLLVSPVSDFRRVIPRPNPFTFHRHVSFGQAMRPPRFRWPGESRLAPLDDIRDISSPICFVHVKNDWLVAHRHSESLARNAQRAELHLLDIPGRYHADKIFEIAPGIVWPIVEDFLRRAIAE